MSFKKFIARIEAENEIFDSLTKAEKRVKIAQDCLERIKAKTYAPKTGSFIHADTHSILRTESDIKSIVNKSVKCTACAKGGLFLSYVGRVNNFLSCNLQDKNRINDNEHIKLLEIFTATQLSLIEYAFEGSVFIQFDTKNKPIYQGDKYNKAFFNFYCKYNDVTNRMIAICENIIKNKGTFKP